MKTLGRSAATTLLLFLHLATESIAIDPKIAKSKQALNSNGKSRKVILEELIIARNGNDTEIVASAIAEDPAQINKQILSLLDRNGNVQGGKNDQLKVDQHADQSEAVILSVEDMKDLENLEDAFSLIEYEPQKINSKKKRKTGKNSKDLTDTTARGTENTETILPQLPNIYYDVPRTMEPRKNIPDTVATPKFYLKPPQKSSDYFEESDQFISPVAKKKTRNTEYVLPAQPPSRAERARLSRNRLQQNLQTPPLVQTEELKYGAVPQRTITSYRPYSAVPIEPKRGKYIAEPIVVTTPSNDASYTTKSAKRKKNRKRVVEKSVSQENAPRAQSTNTYNVNVPPSAIRNPANAGNYQQKSESFGLLSKYDVAPRPFAITKLHADVNEEGDSRKLQADVEPKRYPYSSVVNTLKKKNYPDSNSLQTVANGNVYDKRGSQEDFEKGALQLNQGKNIGSSDDPIEFEYKKLQVSGEPQIASEESVLAFDSYRNTKDTGSFENANAENSSRHPLYYSSSSTSLNVPTKSSLDEEAYKSTRSPVLSPQLLNPVSTIIPYATLSPVSGNLPLRPTIASTLPPLRHFEDGNVRSRVQGNSDGDVETVEKIGHVRAKKEDNSEEISDVESKRANRESKMNVYETHEEPNEGHGAVNGHQKEESSYDYVEDGYPRNDQYRNEKESETANEHDGSERNGSDYSQQIEYDDTDTQKYNRRNAADTHHDGSEHHRDTSHDETHQGQKESKGSDDNSGGEKDGGGEAKFEKGGGAKKEEEHHVTKGEKGNKGYKSWHENDKANKGHHDKVKHTNYYDEKDGKEKEQEEEGGYHEEHHEGEKGKKEAEFGEKGEHQKGHSTKGQHFVHKKDEYEKKTEFFDEFHEDGESEKDGEYYQEHEKKEGGHEKSNHHEEKDHVEKYGKEGKHMKGKHYHENKGHKIGEGHDSHYDHEEAQGKKSGQDQGKKWAYKENDHGADGGKDEGADHKSRR